MNIVEVAEQQLLRKQSEDALTESTKVGTLRVGNSGVVDDEGTSYGKCARQTHLRFLGVGGEKHDLPRLTMFAGGKSNEDIWYSLLSPTFPNIKREEEIPVSWVNDHGITVTGRPDMVILDEQGTPVHGVELKMVASVWTSRDVRFQGAPKLDHLCQAAHYMMLLDIPFTLAYTQYVEFPVVGWMQRNFPKQGTSGSEACEYNDKGDIKKVVPYMWGYALRWDTGGALEYSHEGKDAWTKSVVSKDGLKRYYNQFQGREKAYTLIMDPSTRPVTANAQGERNKGWSLCDAAYCPYSSLCDKAEAGRWSLGDWSDMALSLGGSRGDGQQPATEVAKENTP